MNISGLKESSSSRLTGSVYLGHTEFQAIPLFLGFKSAMYEIVKKLWITVKERKAMKPLNLLEESSISCFILGILAPIQMRFVDDVGGFWRLKISYVSTESRYHTKTEDKSRISDKPSKN